MDLKREKVEVDRLVLGMYVAELDRPWIDTPFLLQGFLLDDPEDVHTLMSTCTFVYIDRTKSLGNQYVAPAKQSVAIKREGSVVRLKEPKSKISSNSISSQADGEIPATKISFFDVLKDLKSKSQENTESPDNGATIYKLRYGASTAVQEALPFEPDAVKHDSLVKQLTKNVGEFIGGFFNREKLKSAAEASEVNKQSEGNHEADYNVKIFEEELPVEVEIAAIVHVYEQSQIATRHIFETVANEQNLDLTAVSEVLDSMVESIGRTPDALLWLAKLKKTDDYAYNHALNVSITLMAFGNFLALSKKQIKELGLAGLLQDVGKVKISSDILLKQSKLTHEEFEHAKKHVDESLKILETTANIPNSVIFLVAQHHERIDGSGYPYQLSKNQIGLMSQAAGLIDTYCALTSHKSYAKGVFHQQALDEIHHLSGKQFSRELIDQLVQFMGMYPVSSLVELNTGEVAVVIQQNQVRRLLPRLMLLLDPDKVRYETPIILNLLINPNTPSGEPYKIVRSLAPDSYDLSPDDFYV